jgi:hypothetical protein
MIRRLEELASELPRNLRFEAEPSLRGALRPDIVSALASDLFPRRS